MSAAGGAAHAADARASIPCARDPSCGTRRRPRQKEPERRAQGARASLLVVPLPKTSWEGANAASASPTSRSSARVSMTRCKSTRGAPPAARSSTAKPHFSRPGSSAAILRLSFSPCIMASLRPPGVSRLSRRGAADRARPSPPWRRRRALPCRGSAAGGSRHHRTHRR